MTPQSGSVEESGTGQRRDDFSDMLDKQLGRCIFHLIVCIRDLILYFPDEDNLVDVVEEVINLAAKWKSLGFALRLKSAMLESIYSNHPNDTTECLRDMLLAWLKQRYDIKQFGRPSWSMLCTAIRKESGGNDPALARRIEENHK